MSWPEVETRAKEFAERCATIDEPTPEQVEAMVADGEQLVKDLQPFTEVKKRDSAEAVERAGLAIKLIVFFEIVVIALGGAREEEPGVEAA